MLCSHYPISRLVIAHMCCAPGGPHQRIARSCDFGQPCFQQLTLNTKGCKQLCFFLLYVIKMLQDALLKYPGVLESWTCAFAR